MATKSRVSLRTNRRRLKVDLASDGDNTAAENDDALPEVGSPRVPRLGLASPVTPRTTKTTAENKSADESLDDDILSQQPTPSKYSYLLPNYFESHTDNPDDSTLEVLWDCSSPDAIRHLRRRTKDSSVKLKELVKHFKGVEPSEVKVDTSPHLKILRASLLRQKQRQLRNTENGGENRKKSKRSARKPDPYQQEILARIMHAIKLRSENSKDADTAGPSTASESGVTTTQSLAPAEGEENKDSEHDDSWSDDDLFENNSFIIQATQNPELFLDVSGTSTPKRDSARCAVNKEAPESRTSQQQVSLNSTSVLESQNSGVIPPTLVPADSQLNHPANTATGSKFIGGEKTKVPVGPGGGNALLSPIRSHGPLSPIHSHGPLSPIRTNSLLGKRHMAESPRSRYHVQRQAGNWPRRLLSPALHRLDPPLPENAASSAQQSIPSTNVAPAARPQSGQKIPSGQQAVPPTHNSSSARPGQTLRSSNSATAQQAVKVNDTMRAVDKATGRQTSLNGTGRSANNASTRANDNFTSGHGNGHGPHRTLKKQQANTVGQKSGHVKLGNVFSTNAACNSTTQNAASGYSNKTSIRDSHASIHTNKAVSRAVSGAPQTSNSKPNLASTSAKPAVGVATLSVNNDSDDAFDDSLSEELLVKLTEQDDMFESQAIQEFPTQAPKKPIGSSSKVPAADVCDFDDMDDELLSSICEFDSFSGLPGKGINDKNQQSAPITKTTGPVVKNSATALKPKYGPSESKQARLYGSAVHKPAASGGVTFNGNKKSGPSFQPSAGTRTAKRSNATTTAGQVSVSARGISNNHQSLKSAKPATGVVYPSTTLSRCGAPLATLATSNTSSNVPQPSTKKFSFKPLSGTNSGRTVSTAGVTSTKAPSTNVSGTFSQDIMEDDDDDLADDALYESQIIAMLDQVESQVSQQIAGNRAQTPPKASPLKCSQEEIEKKRQAAMARRLRSASRPGGKPP